MGVMDDRLFTHDEVAKGSNRAWRRRARAALRYALAGVGLLVALSQLSACAGRPKPQYAAAGMEGPAEEITLNPPSIISGSPKQDLRAYEQAEEMLSEADWAILEQLGPRPIWEQLSGRRGRSCQGPPGGRGVAGQYDDAPRPDDGGAVAATPPARPPVSLDDLPLEIIPLPDGQLRLIWVLRGYGGSTVTSASNGNTSRRTVTVAAADLTALVSVLTPVVGKEGSVVPLPKENTLVITCAPAAKDSIVDLLARLDVPPRQVEITAKIFEVSHDFDFQQGTELIVNRLASDNGQNLTSTFSARRFLDSLAGTAAGGPVQGSVLKLMQTFADAGVSVDVSFQLLAEAGMIQVVSQPRMTVAVGQTGYMLAGQELPIQSANFVNNVLQTATSYKPVGVQLYVTPQSAGPDQVKLHTISIVSSVSGFAPLPTMERSGAASKNLINPIIDSREAETQVTINAGDTLVISGLRMIRTTTRENKIPGLGDLPVAGWLFKNHRSQQHMTDLYFFVTPTML